MRAFLGEEAEEFPRANNSFPKFRSLSSQLSATQPSFPSGVARRSLDGEGAKELTITRADPARTEAGQHPATEL